MKIFHCITTLTIICFLSCESSVANGDSKLSVNHNPQITDTLEGVTVTRSDQGTTITGVYNGYNLFIQNPIAFPDNQTTKGCIQLYPSVNGNVTTRIVTSTQFELDLSEYGLKQGDNVTIEISHGDCDFKILNLEVLKPNYIPKK